MKLLYVYIEHGRDNPIIEMNFSRDYQYRIEKQNGKYIMTRQALEAETKVSEKFWNDDARLYNVSAIVGDNGAGKTSIINELILGLESLHKSGSIMSLYFTGAMLLEDCIGKKTLYFSMGETDSVIRQFEEDIEQIDARGNSENPFFKDINATKTVHMSNSFSLGSFYKRQKFMFPKGIEQLIDTPFDIDPFSPVYDCSVEQKIRNIITFSGLDNNTKSKLELHKKNAHLNEVFNQVAFYYNPTIRKIIAEVKEKSEKLGINEIVPWPDSLSINVLFPKIEKKILYQFEGDFFSQINELMPHIGTGDIISALQYNCLKCLLAKIDFKKCQDKQKEIQSEILESLKNPTFKADAKQAWASTFSVIAKYETYLKCGRNSIEDARTFIEFVFDKFTDNSEEKNDSIVLSKLNFINMSKEYELGVIDLEKTNPELLYQFIELYKKVVYEVPFPQFSSFISFGWGMSSGESNWYNMFTDLWLLINNESICNRYIDGYDKNRNQKYTEKQKCDSLIIFIDEADLSFHPEWQRRYIFLLTQYITRLFSKEIGCKSIQVILATHSPIILGDFPKACVTYLSSDKKGSLLMDEKKPQLFGQNLYTILQDGFYLKEGTIGLLAQSKIKSVLLDTKSVRSLVESIKENKDVEKINKLKKQLFELRNNLNSHNANTICYLADGIIKAKLLDELDSCEVMISSILDPPEEQKSARMLKIQRLEKELAELKKGIEE